MTEQSFSDSELVPVEAELVQLPPMAFVGKVETGELDILDVLMYRISNDALSHTLYLLHVLTLDPND